MRALENHRDFSSHERGGLRLFSASVEGATVKREQI